jgi:hypothetical protein
MQVGLSIGLVVLIVFGMPWVFMSLWNYLMPILFIGANIGTLTYWQSWGTIIMVRILTHNTTTKKD